MPLFPRLLERRKRRPCRRVRLHVVDGRPRPPGGFAANWSQTLIVNPPLNLETTTDNLKHLLDDGRADLVAVGRAFLADPHLVRRLGMGAELNVGAQSSFHGGTYAGYMDYPTLEEVA
ncbi:MAG: hypothetical protein M3Q47_18860 [Actinomycetota bacterium]|nr:hypothetical protein [Actinomycetota bacterium]